MRRLDDYCKIKNKYCICYFGTQVEYLKQLENILPLLTRKFPGLDIYLSSKDEYVDTFRSLDKVVPLSKLSRDDFGYVKEIRSKPGSNPVEQFLKDSGILEKIV